MQCDQGVDASLGIARPDQISGVCESDNAD